MKLLGLPVGIGAAMTCLILAVAPAPAAQAGSNPEMAMPAAKPQTLFALIYRPGPKWQAGKPFREQIAIKGHFDHMKALFAKGQIFAAGGLGIDHGLVLLHARDQAEADAILAADPMVQAGSFAGEIRPYAPSFLSDGPLTRSRE